jgi:hypothetical protein
MELGAAFRCADLGIPPEIRENHAAHVGHWLRVLKDDKHVILSAATHASPPSLSTACGPITKSLMCETLLSLQAMKARIEISAQMGSHEVQEDFDLRYHVRGPGIERA